jgi:RHS repeat-associated protein
VNYTYDSLKRLSTAGTAAAGWGQAYTYDGFGNMTAATVTQGSGVNFTQSYDPGTNHAVANPQFAYEANGNEVWPSASYDGENRMTSPDGYNTYIYDPQGKRVWASATGALYFYDIFGKQVSTNGNVYFGNRMVVSQGGAVVTDRLGSVRSGGNGGAMSYLPYGVEQTATPNNQTKFGTYLRDGNSSTLGLDYADQRYYNPWYGRFNTPDPGGVKTSNPADPGSWNRYAYTRGDPINNFDPTGTDPCSADGFLDAGCYDPCANDFDPSVDPYNSQCGGGSGPGYWGPAAIGAAIAAVAAAAAQEAAAAEAPAPPQCSISLEERPVGGIAGKVGAQHTYLYLQGPADLLPSQGSETVEGGPDFIGLPIGYLMGFVSNPPGGPNALDRMRLQGPCLAEAATNKSDSRIPERQRVLISRRLLKKCRSTTAAGTGPFTILRQHLGQATTATAFHSRCCKMSACPHISGRPGSRQAGDLPCLDSNEKSNHFSRSYCFHAGLLSPRPEKR